MTQRQLTDDEADYVMAQADGALGAAGHAVTDPVARAIIRSSVKNEISGEEARDRILALHGLPPKNR